MLQHKGQCGQCEGKGCGLPATESYLRRAVETRCQLIAFFSNHGAACPFLTFDLNYAAMGAWYQVHADGKPIPHQGGQGYDEEALLHQTAERTVGYSGAELAGLLNEASILAVCLCLPDSALVTAACAAAAT